MRFDVNRSWLRGLLAAAMFWPLGAAAQWTPLSLPDNTVRCLVVDPTNSLTLYVATDNGLYKSSNGGASWGAVLAPGPNLGCIIVDPLTPTTLYTALGNSGGVYKSIDGANSWFPSDNGLNATTGGAIPVTTLAVDPLISSNLYLAETGTAIWKSYNGATTWVNSSTGIPASASVVAIAIDPRTTSTLYAGIQQSAIQKSVDGGGTWNPIGSGFSSGGAAGLAVDPSNSNIVYAVANDPSAGSLFKSLDGGQSFSVIGAGVFQNFGIYAFTVDPITPTTLYAATGSYFTPIIVRSTDGGASWTKINANLTLDSSHTIANIVADPHRSGQVYIAQHVTAGASGSGVSVQNFNAPNGASAAWWWNPAEAGRAYAIELAGDGNLRLGILGFDSSGLSHWWIAQGPLSSDGSFTGSLQDIGFGSPLGLAYRAPVAASAGLVALRFTSPTTGLLALPNGAVKPIQRFQFTPGGIAAGPGAAVPQAGWWQPVSASGVTFFLEVQAGTIDIGTLAFDPDGGPSWFNSTGPMSGTSGYSGAWNETIGGQTLFGAYSAPLPRSPSQPAALTFSGPTNGTLTFGGVTVPIQRLGF